jgi:hypothetical protein
LPSARVPLWVAHFVARFVPNDWKFHLSELGGKMAENIADSIRDDLAETRVVGHGLPVEDD